MITNVYHEIPVDRRTVSPHILRVIKPISSQSPLTDHLPSQARHQRSEPTRLLTPLPLQARQMTASVMASANRDGRHLHEESTCHSNMAENLLLYCSDGQERHDLGPKVQKPLLGPLLHRHLSMNAYKSLKLLGCLPT